LLVVNLWRATAQVCDCDATGSIGFDIARGFQIQNAVSDIQGAHIPVGDGHLDGWRGHKIVTRFAAAG